jgi:hypothetical protein
MERGGEKVETRIRKLLARLGVGQTADKEPYVTGSGLVRVPKARLAEIPKVIGEHHALEAERAKLLAMARASQMR